MELRDYQLDIAEKAVTVLKTLHLVYISAEVRTGKTLMALQTAKLYGATNVLFLTKKKAIDSILSDYHAIGYDFTITVINDESLHKLPNHFDLIIHDEHHRFGALGKPGKYCKLYKQKFHHLPMIFLSGTPTPESYSQIYHQLWVSDYCPFPQRNFYAWAKHYVDIQKIYLGHTQANDYTRAHKHLIDPIVSPYFIRLTQSQAGFKSTITENILYCQMSKRTYDLVERLRKDLLLQGAHEVVLADTKVKLMQKLHQLYSGTVKFESGNATTLDTSKALFIRNYFKNQKIAIFYKFKQEYQLLKSVFDTDLTDDITTFNATAINIALQIQSGREGTNLSSAQSLVFYNIDFSAVSYWQARDRMSTLHRDLNTVYYVFANNGIEEKIYACVINKKDYTLNQFTSDYA